MTAPPRPPDVPGHSILAYLGRGGMGTVWKARRDDGRLVALKLLYEREGLDLGDVRRLFRRESLACLNIDHPHLVRGVDVGRTDDGDPYLALEFVEGETLWDRVRRTGPLTDDEVVRVGVQVADALAYAHARKLVHGDVKPQNVMLDERGVARLLDLGLVTAPGVARGERVYGTAAYVAPETLRGAEPSSAADLYALGATLLAALTGNSPYEGRDARRIVEAALAGPPAVPERVGDRVVSDDVRRVLTRLTRPTAAERYGSAEELRLELESLLDGDSPLAAALAEHAGPGGPRPARPLVPALVVGVVALGAAAWWFSRPPEPPPPDDASSVQPDVEPPATPDRQTLEVEALLESIAAAPDDFAGARAWIERLRTQELGEDLRGRVERASEELEDRFAAQADELLATRRVEADRLAADGDWEGARQALSVWPELFARTEQAAASRASFDTLVGSAEKRLAALIGSSAKQADAWTQAPPDHDTDVRRLANEVSLALEKAPPESPSRAGLDRVAAALVEVVEQIDRARGEDAAWTAWRSGTSEAAGAEWRPWLVRVAGDEQFERTRVGRLVRELLAATDAADRILEGALASIDGAPWAGPFRGTVRVDERVEGLDVTDVFDRWTPDPATELAFDEAVVAGLHPDVVVAWRFVRFRAPLPDDSPWHALCAGVTLDERPPPGAGTDWALRLTLATRGADTPLDGLVATTPVTERWLEATRGTPKRRTARSAAREAAREAFLDGALVAAWNDLVSAEAEAPGDAEVAVLRGRVLWALSEPLRTARVAFEVLLEARRAWDLDPGLAAGPQLAAQAALHLLDTESVPGELIEPVALLACEETWRQGQATGPALRLLGARRLEDERARDAAPMLRRAAELLPRDGSVQLLLGKAELELRRKDAAKAALLRARELLGADFPPWASTILGILDTE